MYNKILVPLDGSKLAEHILEHVKVLAKGDSHEVILLRIIEPLLISFKADMTLANKYREEEDRFEKSVRDYLSGIAESLEKSGISARIAISRLTHGSTAGEILNFAKENEVDLIIMSTHGKTGSSRWHFGSVANKVTTHSIAPVLVIPPSGFRNE